MPDIDPNDLVKKQERIEQAERLWDAFIKDVLDLFERRPNDITAADRNIVAKMMRDAGVQLDPKDLPQGLLEKMRRAGLGNPTDDLEEDLDEDVTHWNEDVA
jgi:hypothetical protein